MDREEILRRVIKLISDRFNISGAELSEKSRLVEDINCDSLDIIEMVMEAEDMFDIDIPDEEAENLRTIGDVVDCVMKHSNSTASSGK